jgi:hypothetical protein
MSLLWIVVLVLVVLAIVSLVSRDAHGLGYWPGGGLGLVVLILVLFILFRGRL